MIRISARTANTMRDLNLKVITFPGGEIHVTVETNAEVDSLTIAAHLSDSAEVMTLLNVTDAVRRAYAGVPVDLFMPYTPYARQDRVANDGESLGAKVMCDLINSQNYDRVIIQDPHSDVVPALLNRVVIDDPLPALKRAIATIAGPVALVAPDAGARKRVLGLAKKLGGLPVVLADKYRDTATGHISGTKLSSELVDCHLLIVDDICDGGWTFLELAKALRAEQEYRGLQNPISLYVTHGIFSKGLDSLVSSFKHIFTRNNWTSDDRCVLV